MGESEGDSGAAPSGSATNVQLCANRLRAAVHRPQAVAAWARLGGHADTVVDDRERDGVRSTVERHRDHRAAGVADGVGQRLGGDAVGVGGDQRRQRGRVAHDVDARHAGCDSSAARSRSSSSTGRPSSGVRSSATLVSMSEVAARSSADGTVKQLTARAAQRPRRLTR